MEYLLSSSYAEDLEDPLYETIFLGYSSGPEKEF